MNEWQAGWLAGWLVNAISLISFENVVRILHFVLFIFSSFTPLSLSLLSLSISMKSVPIVCCGHPDVHGEHNKTDRCRRSVEEEVLRLLNKRNTFILRNNLKCKVIWNHIRIISCPMCPLILPISLSCSLVHQSLGICVCPSLCKLNIYICDFVPSYTILR